MVDTLVETSEAGWVRLPGTCNIMSVVHPTNRPLSSLSEAKAACLAAGPSCGAVYKMPTAGTHEPRFVLRTTLSVPCLGSGSTYQRTEPAPPHNPTRQWEALWEPAGAGCCRRAITRNPFGTIRHRSEVSDRVGLLWFNSSSERCQKARCALTLSDPLPRRGFVRPFQTLLRDCLAACEADRRCTGIEVTGCEKWSADGPPGKCGLSGPAQCFMYAGGAASVLVGSVMEPKCTESNQCFRKRLMRQHASLTDEMVVPAATTNLSVLKLVMNTYSGSPFLGRALHSLQANGFDRFEDLILVMGSRVDPPSAPYRTPLFQLAPTLSSRFEAAARHEVVVITTTPNLDLHGYHALHQWRHHPLVRSWAYFYVLDSVTFEPDFPLIFDATVLDRDTRVLALQCPNSNIAIFGSGVVRRYGQTYNQPVGKLGQMEIEFNMIRYYGVKVCRLSRRA